MTRLTNDFRLFINRDNNLVQLLVMVVLIFATMSALSPDKFLRYYNFESITYLFPELGVLSIAMLVAMMTANKTSGSPDDDDDTRARRALATDESWVTIAE